jgi:hypothetical protein
MRLSALSPVMAGCAARRRGIVSPPLDDADTRILQHRDRSESA